jgi:hypothetical protein
MCCFSGKSYDHDLNKGTQDDGIGEGSDGNCEVNEVDDEEQHEQHNEEHAHQGA